MSKSRVIAFVGTVGSGKSTQMRILALELRRRKTKVKVTFLKTAHIFAYLLGVILVRIFGIKRRKVFPIRALIEEKPHIFRKIFCLWLNLDIFSIFVKFLINIYIPLKLGYIVLVEDYIPAMISDYIYLKRVMGFPLKTRSFTTAFLLRLMYLGGPTQIVFLDAGDDILKSRWKVRGSFSEKKDYLNMQRTILLQISRRLSSNTLLYLNTDKQAIKDVHQLIKKQQKHSRK